MELVGGKGPARNSSGRDTPVSTRAVGSWPGWGRAVSSRAVDGWPGRDRAVSSWALDCWPGRGRAGVSRGSI